jgi:hypothetical protein
VPPTTTALLIRLRSQLFSNDIITQAVQPFVPTKGFSNQSQSPALCRRAAAVRAARPESLGRGHELAAALQFRRPATVIVFR